MAFPSEFSYTSSSPPNAQTEPKTNPFLPLSQPRIFTPFNVRVLPRRMRSVAS